MLFVLFPSILLLCFLVLFAIDIIIEEDGWILNSKNKKEIRIIQELRIVQQRIPDEILMIIFEYILMEEKGDHFQTNIMAISKIFYQKTRIQYPHRD